MRSLSRGTTYSSSSFSPSSSSFSSSANSHGKDAKLMKDAFQSAPNALFVYVAPLPPPKSRVGSPSTSFVLHSPSSRGLNSSSLEDLISISVMTSNAISSTNFISEFTRERMNANTNTGCKTDQ